MSNSNHDPTMTKQKAITIGMLGIVVLSLVAGPAGVATAATDFTLESQAPASVAPGESFDVTYTINNTGTDAISDLGLQVTGTSNDLTILDTSSEEAVIIPEQGAVIFGTVEPGETATVTLTIQTNESASTPLSLGAEATSGFGENETVRTDTSVITVNAPPSADAGPDQEVLGGTEVKLNASGTSDSNGDVLNYTWEQISGPSVALSSNSAEAPVFTAPEVETPTSLSFGLTARDGSGATDTDTVNITVQPTAADFQVSNLSAPDTVSQGDTINVSADVTNAGDGADSRTVEFRLDLNQDGTLSDDEALTTQNLDLAPSETQAVTFRGVDTSGLSGGYTHGVFTADSNATAQITVETTTPTANVAFENQTTEGTTVVVDSVTMSEGGFVAIHNSSLFDGNVIGSVIGVSDYLAPGTHEDVEVTLYDVPGASFNVDSLPANETLVAMPHLDTNENETYDFVATGGGADGPYTEDGSPVIDTAEITVEQEQATFDVSNLSAPDTANEGDLIDVSADITNTGEQAATKTVEFRLDLNQDGTISEDEALTNQSVSLDPGETETVTFVNLDSSGLDGEYNHGVFTEDDNTTAEITVETEEPEVSYYQVDFIGGEPYEELGPNVDNGFYADNDEDRLFRYAFGNTEEGITSKGTAWPSEDLRQCVDYQHVSQDGDTASITFTVNESCEDVTLSLAVYEKDDPGFDRDMVQVLSDSDSGTFGPGTYTLTVELPDSDESDE
jgi:uncharacterized membrane protein